MNEIKKNENRISIYPQRSSEHWKDIDPLVSLPSFVFQSVATSIDLIELKEQKNTFIPSEHKITDNC